MRPIEKWAVQLAGLLMMQCAYQIALSAEPPHAGPTPRVISRTHQPAGSPHKASSFAPHHTNRRVFGAPIQSPILSNATPRKKDKPR